MEAMQFTDNGLYTLVEKKHKRACVHTRAYLASGRRDVN